MRNLGGPLGYGMPFSHSNVAPRRTAGGTMWVANPPPAPATHLAPFAAPVENALIVDQYGKQWAGNVNPSGVFQIMEPAAQQQQNIPSSNAVYRGRWNGATFVWDGSAVRPIAPSGSAVPYVAPPSYVQAPTNMSFGQVAHPIVPGLGTQGPALAAMDSVYVPGFTDAGNIHVY